MIIIGIDPGTTQIGFGVIRNESNYFESLDYGIIRNIGKDKLFDYKNTAKELSRLIKKYNPDVASVERLFFFKNQKTVMAVSEMRGVIMLTLANHNLPVFEFTPLQVKQSLSGYGRADKNQIQRMVRLILGIKEEIKPDDAADALAIAICGVNNKMI
ncbi:MAG: crossover junction endodeoxyribonuclease RuvC [Candidatus Yanofskybacteria bacterium RIFCSPLOWO2_01_FULL_41_34]|uniref:Crossover junction endodeoxyribonuclease RuvC n=1 Tax=Candidatus Yanofskybacteria bacterium RIFCSPHIGHO2_01_FULL_41_26 TaxID=1802661 RepID=A0A1F8EBN6_9BACT|nr:MAG: crossover junction endodeoxyribonuclease RuvC [Candidatus Yanofskybacteria bacterium RIFCSPHIGHO2_01_FULL_41_26]OGN21651.1 MAG: crossover junction endodeoxyribonuclease RuvC [Candidatus Yanofskybacteria bacterium RIFCSPLOWO2_01_FULL_41_34]